MAFCGGLYGPKGLNSVDSFAATARELEEDDGRAGRRGRVGGFWQVLPGVGQLILGFCSGLFCRNTSQSFKLVGKELAHHLHLLAHQALNSGFRCAAFVILRAAEVCATLI